MNERKFPVMPHDKESANHVLNMFNDMAFNFKYRNEFTSAVHQLYGPYFIIGQDLRKRMYFKCMSCNKEMNNTRSLFEHSVSAAHIKNVDKSHQEEIAPFIPVLSRKKGPINYGDNVLQGLVDGSSIPILGLHKIEHFSDGRTSYYRCCLCMVHSNCDAMYFHLIGNKHTDKYIKYRLVIKSNYITEIEREHLRNMIYYKDNYSGSSIVTILGTKYFPYTLSRNYLTENVHGRVESCTSNSFIDHSCKAKETEDTVSRFSAGSQTDFPIELYTDILNKFAFMVNTDHMQCTKLVSPDDLRLALIVMVFSLLWIYCVNESFLKDNVNVVHHEKQKGLISCCLGHVIKKLGDTFKRKHPHMRLTLD